MSSRGEKKAAKPVEPQQWWEGGDHPPVRRARTGDRLRRPLRQVGRVARAGRRGPVGAAVLIAYGKNPVEVAKFFKAFNAGANLQPGSALLAVYKFYF